MSDCSSCENVSWRKLIACKMDLCFSLDECMPIAQNMSVYSLLSQRANNLPKCTPVKNWLELALMFLSFYNHMLFGKFGLPSYVICFVMIDDFVDQCTCIYRGRQWLGEHYLCQVQWNIHVQKLKWFQDF